MASVVLRTMHDHVPVGGRRRAKRCTLRGHPRRQQSPAATCSRRRGGRWSTRGGIRWTRVGDRPAVPVSTRRCRGHGTGVRAVEARHRMWAPTSGATASSGFTAVTIRPLPDGGGIPGGPDGPVPRSIGAAARGEDDDVVHAAPSAVMAAMTESAMSPGPCSWRRDSESSSWASRRSSGTSLRSTSPSVNSSRHPVPTSNSRGR